MNKEYAHHRSNNLDIMDFKFVSLSPNLIAMMSWGLETAVRSSHL